MKKNSGLFSLAGLLILCATLAAFLFPLAPGLARTNGSEAYQGYNFIFSNDAQGAYSSNGGMIAAFTLLIIAAVFQITGFIFSFGQGGRKFAAFMEILAGLCVAASAVIFFLAHVLIGDFLGSAAPMKLGWGFIAAGASSAVSAILSLVSGVLVFKEK
jgi:hypothetical protein